MLKLYNRLIRPLILGSLRILSPFKPKIARGFEGRKTLLRTVEEFYAGVDKTKRRILIHVSSFGELEQAKPVIEGLRSCYPDSIIHLTFFSPSGFDNTVGKYRTPDLITYSPFDNRSDVNRFVEAAKPSIVLYAKYDVWPNFSSSLKQRGIPQVLFSAVVPNSWVASTYFGKRFFREIYSSISKILTIGSSEQNRFEELGVGKSQLLVGGDTRFDQVLSRSALVQPQVLPENVRRRAEVTKSFVMIAGSVWPADLSRMKPFIGASCDRGDKVLYVIVPHEVDEKSLQSVESALPNTIRFSKLEGYDGERVIIVDSIGKLFGLYSEADLAYVGGGFGDGVHNTLEPAVRGIPVLFGPRSEKSPEAVQLVDSGGGFVVTNAREFEFVVWRMMNDADLRRESGEKARHFVVGHTGATERVLQEVARLLA